MWDFDQRQWNFSNYDICRIPTLHLKVNGSDAARRAAQDLMASRLMPIPVYLRSYGLWVDSRISELRSRRDAVILGSYWPPAADDTLPDHWQLSRYNCYLRVVLSFPLILLPCCYLLPPVAGGNRYLSASRIGIELLNGCSNV